MLTKIDIGKKRLTKNIHKTLKLLLFVLLIYLFLPCLMACSLSGKRKTSNSFSIKGNIKNLKESKVYLSIKLRNSSKYLIIDSTLSFNGKFKLSGNLDEPHFAFIQIKPLSAGQKDLNITGWIENSPMQIIGNSTQTDIHILGSKTNELAMEYQTFWQPGYTVEMAQRISKSNDQTNESKQRVTYEQKEKKYFKDLLIIVDKMNPSFYMLYGIYNARKYLSYDQISELLNRINFDLSNFPTGREMIKFMRFYKQVQIGNYAPSFKAIDTSGSRFSFNTINGKLILIDFWASWCRPCRKEFPALKKIYQSYHSKGLEILGIAIKDSIPFWKKAILLEKFPWTNILEAKDTNEQITDIYCITYIPQNILLSSQRKIIAKNVHIDQMDSILNKYLH